MTATEIISQINTSDFRVAYCSGDIREYQVVVFNRHGIVNWRFGGFATEDEAIRTAIEVNECVRALRRLKES